MTATNELRRLLDERGVHWWAGEDERKTLWESNGLTWEYFNDENGDAWLGFLGACEQDITPEQAIAATLGNDGLERTNDGVAERGTCHMEYTVWDDGTCVWGCICSGCGKKFEYETGEGWDYCPKCGARIVEVDE